MPNASGKTRKPAPIAPNNPPRVTSRVKLTQMQMWVNELVAMEFSTRQIARWYTGDAKDCARVSCIAHAKHMGAKPIIRVTEAEYEGLRRAYFIAQDMSDKLSPLMQAALAFNGDMAKAMTSAGEIITIAKSLKGKR